MLFSVRLFCVVVAIVGCEDILYIKGFLVGRGGGGVESHHFLCYTMG